MNCHNALIMIKGVFYVVPNSWIYFAQYVNFPRNWEELANDPRLVYSEVIELHESDSLPSPYLEQKP